MFRHHRQPDDDDEACCRIAVIRIISPCWNPRIADILLLIGYILRFEVFLLSGKLFWDLLFFLIVFLTSGKPDVLWIMRLRNKRLGKKSYQRRSAKFEQRSGEHWSVTTFENWKGCYVHVITTISKSSSLTTRKELFQSFRKFFS